MNHPTLRVDDSIGYGLRRPESLIGRLVNLMYEHNQITIRTKSMH